MAEKKDKTGSLPTLSHIKIVAVRADPPLSTLPSHAVLCAGCGVAKCIYAREDAEIPELIRDFNKAHASCYTSNNRRRIEELIKKNEANQVLLRKMARREMDFLLAMKGLVGEDEVNRINGLIGEKPDE